jgi:hypothetical protein
MPKHLISKLEAVPLRQALATLEEYRASLLTSARASFQALAAEPDFVSMKRLPLTLDLKVFGKQRENFGEVLNQGATLSRAIDALAWVERVAPDCKVWAHPTTSSEPFDALGRSHDLIAGLREDELLMLLEVSDTVADGTDGNDKLAKDLESLGFLDRATDADPVRACTPDDPIRRFLVVSDGLAKLIADGQETIAAHLARLRAARDEWRVSLPRNAKHRDAKTEKLVDSLRRIFRRRYAIAATLEQKSQQLLQRHRAGDEPATEWFACGRQRIFDAGESAHARWMPAMGDGDYTLLIFKRQLPREGDGATNATHVYEVSTLRAPAA